MRSVLSALMAQSPLRDDGWIGSWSPGIGDPTFVGWFTVVAYFAATFLCWRRYRQLAASSPPNLRGVMPALLPLAAAPFVSRNSLLTLPERQRIISLWFGLTTALAFLGVNKQLDLQSALTEVGRMLAQDEGWYANRRKVQAVFILGVVLVCAWLFRSLLNLAAGNVGRLRPVLAGTIFILAFVSIRAASFHHIDRLLGTELGAFKLNWIIELGGIAFVAVGAYRAGRSRPEPRVYQAVPVDPSVGPPRVRRRR